MFKDYYKILGISQEASPSEIKSAYRTMSLKWHPDKNKDTDTDVTGIMQEINEAYAILKDEVKRKRYDEEYNKFIKQHTPTETEYTEDDYSHSQKYEYDYDIQDETLKEDIKEARRYAKELVDEFIKSFKTEFKEASKGMSEGFMVGIKSYIIFAVLAFIAFIVLNLFSKKPITNSDY